MNRCVYRAFLLLGLIIVQFWVIAAGEEEAIGASGQEEISLGAFLQPIDLGEIIVTGKRTESLLSSASENIAVLTEGQIDLLPVRNASEALEYVTGVDIDSRQGFGRPSTVSIQGSQPRQVRVMLEGIPFNNQASGQANLTIFPLENIKQIEVIKGPSSSIWGSSLGGVINVITKDTGTTLIPQGSLRASFAEFGTEQQNLEFYGQAGKLGYYQSLSYMESSGRGLRDDVAEKKSFSKLSYDLEEKGVLTALFGYSAADINSGAYPWDSPIQWQSQPYQARYGKIGWHKECERAAVDVAFKTSRQKIIAESYLALADTQPFWRIQTEDILYQLSLNSSRTFRGNDLFVCGADFDVNILKSNLYLAQAKQLQTQAVYGNYTFVLLPWDLTFGLRYDRNSEYGEEISPSLGLRYQPEFLGETVLRAGVSRAFNAPPLLWRYNSDPLLGVAPNPDIGPERAWVYELGMETKPCPRSKIKLSLYHADVSDALALAFDSSGFMFMKNFEKFRRQGVELEGSFILWEGLTFSAGTAFNDIQDRATGQTVQGTGAARQSFDIGMTYETKKGLAASLQGFYNYWNEPPDSQPNDRKMIFNLKLSQKYKHTTFFLTVFNLTNSKYWRDYFFPYPRRYVEGGFSFNW